MILGSGTCTVVAHIAYNLSKIHKEKEAEMSIASVSFLLVFLPLSLGIYYLVGMFVLRELIIYWINMELKIR